MAERSDDAAEYDCMPLVLQIGRSKLCIYMEYIIITEEVVISQLSKIQLYSFFDSRFIFKRKGVTSKQSVPICTNDASELICTLPLLSSSLGINV